MVKIRLKRLGKKKRPFYRVVVTDIRTGTGGKPIEELGYYDVMSKELKLDKAKALSWIAKGAIPSDSAKRLIDKASETGELIQLEVVKREKLSKKAQQKQASEAAQKQAEAEAAKAAAEEAKAKAAEEAAAAATPAEAPAAPAEEAAAEVPAE